MNHGRQGITEEMASTSKKRKFSNIATVNLLVGPDRTPISVHKDQLCEVSTFFTATFTSNFRETTDGTVTLPEDDVDAVDLFVQWLYYRHCDFLSSSDIDNIEVDHLKQAMQLFVFADKYDIPDLKLYILQELFAYARSHPEGEFTPSESAVEYAYRNTCRGLGIRLFLADWCTCHIETEWYSLNHTQGWLLTLPEFAIDLLAAMNRVTITGSEEYPFEMNEPERYMDGNDSSSDGSPNEESATGNSSSVTAG